MHWLFLLVSIGMLVVAMRTTSMPLMVVCLLASLGLLVAWVMGWYSSRLGDGSRDESHMVDPAELRRLRELAAARKANSQTNEPPVL